MSDWSSFGVRKGKRKRKKKKKQKQFNWSIAIEKEIEKEKGKGSGLIGLFYVSLSLLIFLPFDFPSMIEFYV
jgi:hypothetical protein